jgi:hypothetical protein
MSYRAGREELIMETRIPRCAGLGVHKETVEADVRRIEPDGCLHHQTRQRWNGGNY